MAKSPAKTTVSVTPGKNTRAERIIKFEDLLQNLKGAARGTVSAGEREQLASVQRLATDLEQQLRAVRAAMPDEPGPPPAGGTGRAKGKS